MVRTLEDCDLMNKAVTALRSKLKMSDVVCVDETGINIAGKTNWVHTSVTNEVTYMTPHSKRGRIAIDYIGIIKELDGVLVHDCWSPYFAYENVKHALCNGHIVRELKDPCDLELHTAENVRKYLLDLRHEVERCNGVLNEFGQKRWTRLYRLRLTAAEKELDNYLTFDKKGKIVKGPYRKYLNLLNRLRDLEEAVLLFMTDRKVPFSNNLAEQSIRMLKVLLKVSGCFRNMKSAQGHCRMRSYIDTNRKQKVNSLEAVNMLIKGELPSFVHKWLQEAQEKGIKDYFNEDDVNVGVEVKDQKKAA
jgi:transposase